MEQTPKAILEVRLVKLLRLQVHLTHLLGDPDLTPAKRRKINARMLELDGWISKARTQLVPPPGR